MTILNSLGNFIGFGSGSSIANLKSLELGYGKEWSELATIPKEALTAGSQLRKLDWKPEAQQAIDAQVRADTSQAEAEIMQLTARAQQQHWRAEAQKAATVLQHEAAMYGIESQLAQTQNRVSRSVASQRLKNQITGSGTAAAVTTLSNTSNQVFSL